MMEKELAKRSLNPKNGNEFGENGKALLILQTDSPLGEFAGIRTETLLHKRKWEILCCQTKGVLRTK